jgi:RND family efflux transporter MFP subunit
MALRLLALGATLAIAPLVAAPLAAAPLAAAAIAAAPTVLPLDDAQRVALGLRFAPVAAASAPALSLPGVVVVPPALQRVVAATLDGTVGDLLVTTGDRVQTGQVLARLRSPQLLEMQRTLTTARAQRELAADAMARDERLYAEGLIAQTRLRASQARLREADALYAERVRQLELAGSATREADGVDAGQLTVRAPASGMIVESAALPGQRLAAGAPILTIALAGERWIELQAAPERAAAIAPGSTVTWEARDVLARVRSVSAAVGPGQAVTVRARIERGAERVLPGEIVQAQVRIALPPNARWRVPAAALTRIAEQAVVFVAGPRGVTVTPVSVVARDEDAALIDATLAADDRVAIAGVAALKALAAGQR